MSEQPDAASKTEEPTEKKISDAIEKGNTPVSKEALTFASILAILAFTYFYIGNGVANLASTLGRFIDDPGGISLDNAADATSLLEVVGYTAAGFLAPIVAILATGGLTAAFLQNPPRLVGDRVQPKLSRISPKSGFKRIFGAQGWMEFAKAIFKFLIIGFVVGVLLFFDAHRVVNAMFSDPASLPELLLTLTVRLLSAVCIATILLVVVDIIFTRAHWRKELRMSRQEIKDEHKQMEGDPLVKARMRSLQRDRSRRRMIADIPRATIVIANPTHYAIALRYVLEEGGAPVVVGKGQDLVALKIREVAEQHGIPVIEDKPLARSMYDKVDIDRAIPPEFYKVVAELLYFFYYRKEKTQA
jgi:flagellar biosynthesis protein FlhB